jgi:hypothetical protein
MPDLQQEREHLAQADRHIANGERHVAEQIALLEHMTASGQDTAEGERLLRNFEETLEQFHAHRQLILDAIANAD